MINDTNHYQWLNHSWWLTWLLMTNHYIKTIITPWTHGTTCNWAATRQVSPPSARPPCRDRPPPGSRKWSRGRGENSANLAVKNLKNLGFHEFPGGLKWLSLKDSLDFHADLTDLTSSNTEISPWNDLKSKDLTLKKGGEILSESSAYPGRIKNIILPMI